MVGTAVYQLGLASSSQAKNFNALKPGVQKTLAPTRSEDRIAAIRPWIWNSGMTFIQRSSAVNARVVLMLRAEAHRLRCVSGTILGRDVVPEVCSTSATSSGWARPPDVAATPLGPVSKLKVPAASPATMGSTGIPSFCAAATAGDSLPCSTISALACRSDR
jgi:hypothetical protein